MEPIKNKSTQTAVRLPRPTPARYPDSGGELRGIFKELRERLSAIAEAETRSAAYGEAHPDHR
ncbi:MAG: hypothetical protein IT324_04645 [Anaerolineae bacterium]|nr:hypothetical protein [Anaerolineae bacterium]